MDITSLYYFYEVARELHITNTAKRLFISQQTLSAHIQRLENYYGVKLFNRRPSLSLTYAGEILFESAEKILIESNNVKKKLSEMNDSSGGLIRIGASSFAMRTCMPQVLPHFYSRWPNVKVMLHTGDHNVLMKQLDEGSIDIAITPPTADAGKSMSWHRISMFSDNLFLVVSDELLEKYYDGEAEVLKKREAAGTDLKAFSKLPFMLHKKGLRKRQMIDDMFANAGYEPRVVLETSNTDQLTTMMSLDIGAFFCAESWVEVVKAKNPDINVFPLSSSECKIERTLVVFTNRERYLSTYAKDFVRITERVFKTRKSKDDNLENGETAE